MNGGNMSNITKDQALEQIFEEVLDLDQQGLLEEDIRIICDVYGLDEDDDRDEILGFIAENRFYNGAIY
tara:strand:+ start:34 stop:240 length:207 start_codon:yes stop_codon:yes gene_type:complete